MQTAAIDVQNPYWDIVRRLPGDDIAMRFDGRWEPQSYPLRRRAGQVDLDETLPSRHDLVSRYAWSITDPESVAFVAEHSNGRIFDPLAGTGYWCWLLSQHGVDCVASDEAPPGLAYNHWHSPRDGNDKSTGLGESYFPVAQARAEDRLHEHADRTLLLSWPPYGSEIGHTALTTWAGNRVIYIGETSGGCCGNDDLFRELALGWEMVTDHRPIQWTGMHDWIEVYDRRPIRRSAEDITEGDSEWWLFDREDD